LKSSEQRVPWFVVRRLLEAAAMTIADDCTELSARPAVAGNAAWKRAVLFVAPLARHRLVQFAVLGGALFAVAPRTHSPDRIEVTSDRLSALRAAEAARPAMRMPANERDRAVDQRAIEDEILYREGVRLALDKSDGIVRQRIVQKVLFLAEEMGGASKPVDEAELRVFFEQNKGRWAMPDQHRFAQIYRHDREALAAWADGPKTGDPPLGEPSPVPLEMDANRERIAQALGAPFADALASVPVGAWVGPLQSAYGWHLVRVVERRPARPARLDEVRASVVEAFTVYRRQEATAAFVKSALLRYRVTIDGKPLEGFTPSRRIAFRSVSSGED
jgi:hypothetical protein